MPRRDRALRSLGARTRLEWMEEPRTALPYPESPILVIEGEKAVRDRITELFSAAGLDNVLSTDDPSLASSLVEEGKACLVLLDLLLPAGAGESLLREFSGGAPDTPVIVMTAASDTAAVVKRMRSGATDYVVKPIDETRLFVSVWNALGSLELKREAERFRDQVFEGKLERPEAFGAIVTRDERMTALFRYVESVARSRQPVLISGETGTGKELFARAVHEASGRAGPFIAVNVGGLDDTMFSDSLFGHRKGAYTGADSQRAGLIKEASGGTLLLDEIGDLEPHSQIKLLRLLQEGEYYPLGADSPQRSDVRVVAATTRDLRAAAAAGSFRSDLFYRLQTHPIAIPPLRARPGDIVLLARRFLEASAAELGLRELAEAAGAWAEKIAEILSSYAFPGNVRELQSLVHDAAAGSSGGRLDLDALRARAGLAPLPAPAETRPAARRDSGGLAALPPLALALAEGRIPTIDEAERELVRMAVEAASGNLSQAALILGISRQTLYNKLKGAAKP
jgi:DNA-binding NtrC family response regulator